MPYFLNYLPSATNGLADAWLNAADRDAVRIASHVIDQLLRQAPLSVGIAVGPDRIFNVGPLVVTFRVSPPDRRVDVLEITLRS
jgi:hypothetical protein